MARPLRIQYPGAMYYVTCRGNERKEIFRCDQDRKEFLDLLAQSVNIYNIKIYSYVLMNNHFHLLVETPLGNLGEFMRHFNIIYTSYFNRKHRRSGHLYQGRYKSILVDKNEYLSVLSRYIHLNPVRTKRMTGGTKEERVSYLLNYQWSSLPGYLKEKKREGFIDYGTVLSEYGGDNPKGRESYKKRILNDITSGLDVKDKIIGQSVLGSDEFISWIKERFVKGRKDRESSSMRALQRHRVKDDILKAIEKETGKSLDEIKRERGVLKHVAMDLLYRLGGLKGVEIGEMFEVDYSTVSVGRKRLRDRMQKDRALREMINQIEKRFVNNKELTP